MNRSKILVVLATLAFFVFGLSYVAMGQEKATPQEIVTNVQNAANTLAKSGEPGLVGAGIYDDTATTSDLAKLSGGGK
jgi:hypothetical protein